MTKENIRRQIQREKAGPESGQALIRRLTALPAFQKAETVGAFMPRPDEPDIRPLFNLPDKRFFIPAFDEIRGVYYMAAWSRALRTGKFGIPEPAVPVRAETLDLILVPGLAFDRTGNRLGRGGGFYDRLLAEYPSAATAGLCFDFRLCDALPAEPHDRPVQWIVTETRVLGPF